jgi:uncharacterized protein YbjT (DUF2867 family)
MSGPVVVLGASGNIGGEVERSLTEAGIAVRLAGTDPQALSRRFPSATAVRLDLHDASTFGPALQDARGLFVVRPPAISTVGPTVNALLDVAERLGVEHVVFASVTGADTNPLVPHHRVERHLRRSRLSWTILRPSFFAQNLADAYRQDIVHDDRILLPAADGRAAFIDARDIGEVAARVLADPDPHRGAGYVLTGPRALGFAEVAGLLGEELGRPIRYEATSPLRYARHVHAQGRPWMQAVVQTVLHTGLRRGQAELVDPTLPSLLGRPARSIEQYVHDHRDLWART